LGVKAHTTAAIARSKDSGWRRTYRYPDGRDVESRWNKAGFETSNDFTRRGRFDGQDCAPIRQLLDNLSETGKRKKKVQITRLVKGLEFQNALLLLRCDGMYITL
jgi:hypothetical protein